MEKLNESKVVYVTWTSLVYYDYPLHFNQGCGNLVSHGAYFVIFSARHKVRFFSHFWNSLGIPSMSNLGNFYGNSTIYRLLIIEGY